jgi:hypothetical protein
MFRRCMFTYTLFTNKYHRCHCNITLVRTHHRLPRLTKPKFFRFFFIFSLGNDHQRRSYLTRTVRGRRTNTREHEKAEERGYNFELQIT